MSIYTYIPVYVDTHTRTHAHISIHARTHTHVYIYIPLKQLSNCDTILRSISLWAVSLLGQMASMSSKKSIQGALLWKNMSKYYSTDTIIIMMKPS